MKIAKLKIILRLNYEGHKPVLLKEVIEVFNPKPGQVYIDATINGGGHARALLERIGKEGRLLGIDRDCSLIEGLREQSERAGIKNMELACGSFADIEKIANTKEFLEANGILFDLGFSSYHIEESQRGFSFLRDEPLDMRYNPEEDTLTAAHIVNTWALTDLEKIIREWGEERFARNIAKGIVRARERKHISTTKELADIITRSIPPKFRHRKVHAATRSFQAIRIAVNEEFEHIRNGLEGALRVLGEGGVLGVISFHSLEDRMVKNYFQEQKRAGLYDILTLHPIRASALEIKENPRARSANLRAIQKI